MTKRIAVFCAATIAACEACAGLALPSHAQSLFWQTESLARDSGSFSVAREKNGTAFFVDGSGDMLTAGHAAQDCARVLVAKEGRVVAARVVAISSRVDLALVKVVKTLGLSAVFPRSVTAGTNEMLFAAAYDTLSIHSSALGNATIAAGGNQAGYIAINSNVTFGASGAPVLDGRGLVQGVISRRVSNDSVMSVTVPNQVPLPLNRVSTDRHVLAVSAAEAKAFLAANHIAVEEDDRPQIAPSGSRASRAASISARVTCLQN